MQNNMPVIAKQGNVVFLASSANPKVKNRRCGIPLDVVSMGQYRYLYETGFKKRASAGRRATLQAFPDLSIGVAK